MNFIVPRELHGWRPHWPGRPGRSQRDIVAWPETRLASILAETQFGIFAWPEPNVAFWPGQNPAWHLAVTFENTTSCA